MDEIAISVDMPENNSIDTKGVKIVPILTTRQEKNCVIVYLGAFANGHKLKLLVVS